MHGCEPQPPNFKGCVRECIPWPRMSILVYIHILLQLEQEIALIVGKSDIRTHFETAWTSVYVPALLLLGERSKKKGIKDIYSRLVESGTGV